MLFSRRMARPIFTKTEEKNYIKRMNFFYNNMIVHYASCVNKKMIIIDNYAG